MNELLLRAAPSENEQRLLDLVRGQATQNFLLMISSDQGKWIVTKEALDTATMVNGEGSTFAEAWELQQ